jgi:hypothetical protein
VATGSPVGFPNTGGSQDTYGGQMGLLLLMMAGLLAVSAGAWFSIMATRSER